MECMQTPVCEHYNTTSHKRRNPAINHDQVRVETAKCFQKYGVETNSNKDYGNRITRVFNPLECGPTTLFMQKSSRIFVDLVGHVSKTQKNCNSGRDKEHSHRKQERNANASQKICFDHDAGYLTNDKVKQHAYEQMPGNPQRACSDTEIDELFPSNGIRVGFSGTNLIHLATLNINITSIALPDDNRQGLKH